MYSIPFTRLAVLATAVLALGVIPATAEANYASPRPTESPVVFLEHVITAIAANDYAEAWQSLHPAHQAVASEEEYVACEQLSPITVTLQSLVPIRVRRRPVPVAGLSRAVRGVAVTFRLRLENRDLGAYGTVPLTAAAVPVDGHWVWMLPPARYELYRADACKGSSG